MPPGQNVFFVYLAYVFALCPFVFLMCLCLFDVFVSPHSFMFTEQLSHLPYGFFGVSVTDLNEPHRAASTIAWVMS